MGPKELQGWLGGIDVYLFDLVLKGRLTPDMRLLDAGCGSGRNLMWFLRTGFEVAAVDTDPRAVQAARRLAQQLAPSLPVEDFRVEPVEAMSFPDAGFDIVLANAVLHFARDREHFEAMLDGLWRVLAPGGLLFARLASRIGLDPAALTARGGGRFLLPDGSVRYLVDDEVLLAASERLGGQLIEPIRTVVVQGARAMATWCLAKPS